MKIHFSPLTEKTKDYILYLRNTNAEFFMDSGEISPERHEEWFIGNLSNPYDQVFIVRDKSNLAIGMISIYAIDVDNRVAKLGRVIITKEYRNKGFGKKACKLAIKYAKKILGLVELELEVKEDNHIARKLYTDLGFKIRNMGNSSYIMTKRLRNR